MMLVISEARYDDVGGERRRVKGEKGWQKCQVPSSDVVLAENFVFCHVFDKL